MSVSLGVKMSTELADRVLELFKARDEPGLSALFDEPMKEAVPPSKVSEVWHRVDVAGGFLVSSGAPLTAGVAGGELFDYPLRYQKGLYHLQIVVRQNNVSGLLIRPGKPTGQWRRSGGMWQDRLAVPSMVVATTASWLGVALTVHTVGFLIPAVAGTLYIVAAAARSRGVGLPSWL